MSALASSGYTTRILGPESFEDIFAFGAIRVYTGAKPATPNMAPTGTLLGTVTMDGQPWTPASPGYGLEFTREGPYITRKLGGQWIIDPVATGLAGWARLLAPGDPGAVASYTAPRLDFDVNLPGGPGLILDDKNLTQGQAKTIDTFFFSLYPVT